MRPRVSPTMRRIRDKSEASDVHLRDQRLPFAHVLLMAIGWTRVHTIDTFYLTRSYPTRSMLPRVLYLVIRREHSPTQKNRTEDVSINCRAA